MIRDIHCTFCEKRMGTLRMIGFRVGPTLMDFCCLDCEKEENTDEIICDICGVNEEFCLEHNHCFCDNDCCMDRVCPEARKEEC